MKKIILTFVFIFSLNISYAQRNNYHDAEVEVANRTYDFLMNYRSGHSGSALTWLDSGRMLTQIEHMAETVREFREFINENRGYDVEFFLDPVKAKHLGRQIEAILSCLPDNETASKITVGLSDAEGSRQSKNIGSVKEKGLERLHNLFGEHNTKNEFHTDMSIMSTTLSDLLILFENGTFFTSPHELIPEGEQRFYLQLNVEIKKEIATILRDVIQKYSLTDAQVVTLIENIGLRRSEFLKMEKRLKVKLDFKPQLPKQLNSFPSSQVEIVINSTLNDFVRASEIPVAYIEVEELGVNRFKQHESPLGKVEGRTYLDGSSKRLLQAVSRIARR